MTREEIEEALLEDPHNPELLEAWERICCDPSGRYEQGYGRDEA